MGASMRDASLMFRFPRPLPGNKTVVLREFPRYLALSHDMIALDMKDLGGRGAVNSEKILLADTSPRPIADRLRHDDASL